METTKTDKKGRVRHCYPRTELYHRWIHSPEYVYTPKGGHSCAGLGDYLRITNFYHEKTNEHVKECWFSNKNNIIAIIDRKAKRIIISTKYDHHTHWVNSAVPDDFEIFYTNDTINNPDILKNDEELFRTYCKYLIEEIVDNYRWEYLCIANRLKSIHDWSSYHKEYI
ncbi:MAG: hypothetical protein K2M17_05270, partial [Bacilli bacterium]|nr:hypothetical protein [Bacilli bacterium]